MSIPEPVSFCYRWEHTLDDGYRRWGGAERGSKAGAGVRTDALKMSPVLEEF